MSLMTSPRAAFDQPMYVRTTGLAKLALDRVVAAIRASGRLKFNGKRPTQEAIVNASWLWLEDMEPAAVEDAMARYIPKLEAMMRGEDAPPPPAATPKDGPKPRVTVYEDMPARPPRRKAGN